MKYEKPWQGSYGYFESLVAADVNYSTIDLIPVPELIVQMVKMARQNNNDHCTSRII